MGGPACIPGDDEDGRVQLDWDFEQIIGVGCWEVDIRIESFLVEHDLLQNVGDIAPVTVAFSLSNLLGHFGQVHRAAVALFVFAVTKAHDLLLVRQRVSNPCFSVSGCADFHQHAHGLFVGSSMKRALEGADTSDDAAVNVAQGGYSHSAGESGGVVSMLSVKRERCIHHQFGVVIWLVAGKHIEEVCRSSQCGVWGDGLQALLDAIPGSHDRGARCNDANGLANVGGMVGWLGLVIGIVGSKNRIPDASDIHGMGSLGCASQSINDRLGNIAPSRKLFIECIELCLIWQFAVEQKVSGLFIATLLGKIVDIVSAINETTSVAIDFAD